MTAYVCPGQCVSLVSMAYVHLVLCQYSVSLWLQHIMSLVSFTAQCMYCLSLWLHVSIVCINSTVCVYLVFMTVCMCHMSPWLQCMCPYYDSTVCHLSWWLHNSKCAHLHMCTSFSLNDTVYVSLVSLTAQYVYHLSLWPHVYVLTVSLTAQYSMCIISFCDYMVYVSTVSLTAQRSMCITCLWDHMMYMSLVSDGTV